MANWTLMPNGRYMDVSLPPEQNIAAGWPEDWVTRFSATPGTTPVSTEG